MSYQASNHSAGSAKDAEFSRDGKRMFNMYKNRQTFHFGDPTPYTFNPYVHSPSKIAEGQAALENPVSYAYQPEYNPALYENDANPQSAPLDPKRKYAQELLDQINFKNQKRSEEKYEKQQDLALKQLEMQQFRQEEDRQKLYAKQRTNEYREMLEIQSKIKRQIAEKEYTNERVVLTEARNESNIGMKGKGNRSATFNPITGEIYESAEDIKGKAEAVRTSERGLASYGNLVVQARRPY